METLAWLLLWVMVFGGGYWAFLKAGKTALTRHLSEQTPVPEDEWATWKRIAAESRKRKDQDKAEWTREFQEIIQKTCKHDYAPDDLRREKWWTCVLCGYDKPWSYEEGCKCITTEDWALTDMKPRKGLYHRNGNCPVHGRPRLIAYHKNIR